MAISMTGVDQLAKAIEQYELKVKRVIGGQFLWAEAEAERYAKQKAPWNDITTNARNGLFAKASSPDHGKTFELIVAGSVFYQIFLEARFSGRYAIIMPTVNYIGKLLIQRIGQSIDELEAEL